MNINEMLKYPVLSGSQLGDIEIGMSLSSFKNKFVIDDYINTGILEFFKLENGVSYVFHDCIEFVFYSNVLRFIILSQGFLGKFKNTVGIDSSIIDIKKITDEFIYDANDDDYCIDFDDSEIELEITNPFSWDRTDEQLGQCFITEMKLDSFILWEKAVNATKKNIK